MNITKIKFDTTGETLMKNKLCVWLGIGFVFCISACPIWCDDEWIKINSGTSEGLLDVWSSSDDNVYVVGLNGTILHYNGNTWSKVNTGTSAHYWCVWGNSSSNVWAMFSNGVIDRYDGNTWNSYHSGIQKIFTSIWGSSANDVFAAGKNGTIIHYDGNTWSPMNSGTDNHLNNIWGSSANDIFAVGHYGTILHYDGTAWSHMTSGTREDIEGVWGNSANDVIAVRYTGPVLHYDGNSWSPMNSGSRLWLRDVWGNLTNDVYGVGSYGRIMHYDGNVWSKMNSETSVQLSSVGGNNLNVYAVGKNGTILFKPLHRDLILKDKNGDKFYFLKGDSAITGHFLYEGKWASGGKEYACALVYNQEQQTITINSEYHRISVFHYKYQSPNLFEGVYSVYNGALNPIDTYIKIIEGELPDPPPAKVLERNKKITPQQENVLKLGILIPMSGELESLGTAFYSTLLLAQEDTNTYLSEIGSDLTVELFTENNQANPGQTWHSIQRLREQGVSVFLGPQDSPSLDYIKQFADEEDYLLLSSSSTAAELSIPDDNVMRCISDDNNQAAALIDKMKADGIEDIIIVSRTNIYGRGFYQALERGWMADNEIPDDIFGGNIEDATDVNTAVTILFSRPDTDIPDTLVYLQNMLNEETFADKTKTGVVLITYDEGAALMQQASEIEGLGDLRWYGTDSLAQNNALLSNPVAAEFAVKTNFTCTTFAVPQSEAYNAAVEKVTTMLGHTPPALAMIAYDTYQLAVRAYIEAGSDDPQSMKAALQNVAETYEGITGDLRFNTNGDRASGAYEYWTLAAEDGLYFWQSDSGEVWSGDPVLIREWSIFE
jgi:ABC-type branched-subunit amino acid transport system substrate-binding protein